MDFSLIDKNFSAELRSCYSRAILITLKFKYNVKMFEEGRALLVTKE
jgi:hypothetical protein